MNYLVDTNVLLHFVKGDEVFISQKVKKILSQSDNQFTLSVVSLWEVSIKHSIGKLSFLKPPGLWMMDLTQKIGWNILAINAEHALAINDLPLHHKDPFDRLLIVQSQIEGLPLITPDEKFKKYKVQIMW